MVRKLKALGVALAALLAIGALSAGAAVAQETQGEVFADGPVKLDGTELAGKSNAITALGYKIECPGSTWAGHKYNVTPEEGVPVGATTITLTPTYPQAICTSVLAGSSHKTTVTTNGCDYVLHIGETTGVASTYGVTTDVVCPEGKDIQVEVYPFAGSELGGVVCTLTIKAQTGLVGPSLTSNTEKGDLSVEGTFKNLSISQSGSACATESTTTGEWHFNATAKGTDSSGGETVVKVVDEPQPPQQGEVFADGPVKLDGTELAGKSNAITALGYKIECPGSTWAGHKYNVTPEEGVPVGATTITLTPTYPQANCISVLGEAKHRTTVTTNGCDYVLHIVETTGVASTYNVSTDVVCPEGKDVEVDVYAFSGSELGGIACKFTIKAQTGLVGPILTSNTEKGDLSLEGTFRGIAVERSGSGCSTESTTKGEWHFNSTAKGTDSSGGETNVRIIDEPSEQGKISADGSVTLDGTETGENALSAFEFKVECPGSTWTGHKYNVTPHEAIPVGATTFTITPAYVSCKAIESGTHKATVTTNECDFVLHLGETTGAELTYSVSTDIVCPEGKSIQMEVYPFASSELGGAVCTLTVKPQSGLSGPTVTTGGGGSDLQIKGTFKGVSVEKSGSACETESTSKGEWSFNATAKGTNKEGGETSVSVTD